MSDEEWEPTGDGPHTYFTQPRTRFGRAFNAHPKLMIVSAIIAILLIIDGVTHASGSHHPNASAPAASQTAAQSAAFDVCTTVGDIVGAAQSGVDETNAQIDAGVLRSINELGAVGRLPSVVETIYRALETIQIDIANGNYAAAVAGLELVNQDCGKAGS